MQKTNPNSSEFAPSHCYPGGVYVIYHVDIFFAEVAKGLGAAADRASQAREVFSERGKVGGRDAFFREKVYRLS